MTGWLKDIGFATRQLARRPGFSAVVVLTLALGIGPNTAIFTVVNGVLLQPLPYESPEELALFRVDLSGLDRHPGLAQAEVLDFRSAATLSDVGAVSREMSTSITTEGNMQAVLAAQVTPNLFPLLGVEPALGRHFTAEEGVPDEERSLVALVSYSLWQQRYGGDPEILGKTVDLGSRAVPIVGVMPEGFQLLLGPGTSLSPDIDLWIPLPLSPDRRGFWAMRTIGRLAPGATLPEAQAEIEMIGSQLIEQYPEAYENSGIRFYLHPLHGDLVDNVRPAILTLLGAVALVLLIACTNAASLLLANMRSREKELAVRTALGAGRGRIIRQVMSESMILALLAGIVGIFLAAFGLETLLALQPEGLPRADNIRLDGTVLAFTLAAAFVAALAAGVIPAWRASSPEVQESLKEGRRHGGSVRGRTRSALVVAEVAFSLVLLIGAGLLIRSFVSLSSVDLGIDPAGVVTMRVPLDYERFDTPESRWDAYSQLQESVQGLPGVEATGGISLVPLGNQGMISSYSYEESLDTDWNGSAADYRFVLPGYFESMGIRLMAGRDFEARDNQQITPVAIVDVTLANEVWPDEDPIGKWLGIGLGSALEEEQPVEVVGVVEHSRIINVREVVRPQIYLPYRLGAAPNIVLTVRSESNPLAPVAAIRREAELMGTGRPIHTVSTMDSYVSAALGDTRFTLVLMGILASIALILSTVGIYSVITYLVRDRVHEMGIRLALGASQREIVRMNLREGFVLALIGLPIGLFGALLLTGFLDSLLYGVGSTDPVTFAGIPLLLLAVALLASYVPARRAGRIDPLVALRDE
jgi:putative ABC transport system permease protein